MYLILFLFYFIFVFTVEILKSGVSVSLSTCVCDRARVCVRVCERVSFVLSFYQKHTRQINQMSQRDENGTATLLLLPPSLSHSRCRCWWWRTLACSICSLCVCLYSASGVAAAVNCRQFPRQSSATSSPSLLLPPSSAGTHALHTHHHNSCVRPYVCV